MDRSLTSQIRLSDAPNNLNDLIEDWISRFSQPASHAQLYRFERSSDGPIGGATEHVVALYTDNNKYMITARWGEGSYGYLGCCSMARKPRAGEEQHRGADLSDGPFTYETWFRILADIVSYEMVQLAKSARPVPDGYQFPSGPTSAQDAPMASGAPELNPA